MTSKIDILQSLYNATISVKPKIDITNSKRIDIKETDLIIDSHSTKNTKIEYSIPNTISKEYKYSVTIYKIPYRIFGFTINKYRKYLAIVNIYKAMSVYSYSSNPSHKMVYNSGDVDSDIRDTLEKLFNFLIEIDRQEKEKIMSDKIEVYNNDLKKLVNKSVTRDDALDKILGE